MIHPYSKYVSFFKVFNSLEARIIKGLIVFKFKLIKIIVVIKRRLLNAERIIKADTSYNRLNFNVLGK
jgi:hypothetical protein